MAEITLIRANTVFQSFGEIAWNIPIGDRDNFFGWSVRPFQASDTTFLVGVAANSDNNLNQSTDLVVRMSGMVGTGGLIRITGVMVR